MPDIRHKRGTRAALVALAGSSGLKPGQLYVLTDEDRIAVALSTSTFESYAKLSETGTGVSVGLPDYWQEFRFALNNAVSGPFAGAAISTGTANTAIPSASLDGVNWDGAFIRSSTTANGGYKYQTSSLVSGFFGQRSAKFRACFKWLTSFTGRTVRLGFHDSATNADATDGAYFEILDNVVSAKTANNSTRTTSPTTYALTLNVAYTFDIEVNAAGTSARFRIYSGTNSTPVLDTSIVTNIPTSSARVFGTGIVATESSTTASDIGILYDMGFGTANGYSVSRVGVVGATGPAGPMGPKSIGIADPTNSEKLVLFFTTASLTVSKITSVLPAGSATPSVTFEIRYGTDVSGAGTTVVNAGTTVTNVTTGLQTTSFNNATIPAGSFVWLTTSAKSGTVPLLHVTLEF